LTTRPAEVKPSGPPHAPNQNFYYQQLRQLLPSGQGWSVANFTLKRDAAVFTFASGQFTLYGEVNGRVTGAVFRGDGEMKLVPPTAEEKRSLAMLTKAPEIDEHFETAVFRFTDVHRRDADGDDEHDHDAEAGAGPGRGCGGDL